MNTLKHRTNCADPTRTGAYIGHMGDPMIACKSCGRFTVTGPRIADDTEPTPDASPRAVWPYRCREHHDEHVTWQGKGCARCKPAKRKPRAERPTTTEWSTDVPQ